MRHLSAEACTQRLTAGRGDGYWQHGGPAVRPAGLETKPLVIVSGQSNVTKGCIATARGRFSGIRQMAPVYTTPNTCFLRPIQVQIPNGISIGSAVFVQSSSVLYFTMGRSSPTKLPLPIGDMDPI